MLQIRKVYPGSWFFSTPDPGSNTATKEEGKQICSTYFCVHKYHKVKNIFNIWTGTEKNVSQFTKNYSTFMQNIVTKSSQIWVWDPGSEIWNQGSGENLFWIPDPRAKKAPEPESWIQIRNSAAMQILFVLRDRIRWKCQLRSSSTHCFKFFLLISSRFL